MPAYREPTRGYGALFLGILLMLIAAAAIPLYRHFVEDRAAEGQQQPASIAPAYGLREIAG